ncbi:hypothetical protein [Erythrobacter rubeus]|uniref:Uncharacterized protein n=1 Tax=Erythrobacter rubeus TaxID=2760803 RepID=A0ABR8KV94_9SPHN|nr:hypothetical protein [Erythrobacter rubeus]MBD2843133.1 hypothetical protein [Erythrobacter rubeus]
MKLAQGPRPLSINAFAVILLVIAAANLIAALLDVPAQEDNLRSLELGFDWNRDWTIVASSAWFTIELIPIALVWLAASRFARIFITCMAAVKAALLAANFRALLESPTILAAECIALAAVMLLYTRAASRWFTASKASHAAPA